MAAGGLTWSGFLLRWLGAAFLVFAAYNPTGWSYAGWLAAGGADPGGGNVPLKILAGLLLLGGFAVYFRATWLSLGILGIALVVAVFGVFVWLLADYDLVDVGSPMVGVMVVEVILTIVMGVGMSWSHVQRRLTGQLDVDHLDQP
ncbi:DUF6524 family protein [Emcibacter sp. SYSU 3D8]|uniref:DUF6524 family protein n=1 Tax=Emcibacter sp. SYSU 3D8 TaxID=3133969 RepID=UPI0031FE723D